jgi:hypothetical protein
MTNQLRSSVSGEIHPFKQTLSSLGKRPYCVIRRSSTIKVIEKLLNILEGTYIYDRDFHIFIRDYRWTIQIGIWCNVACLSTSCVDVAGLAGLVICKAIADGTAAIVDSCSVARRVNVGITISI